MTTGPSSAAAVVADVPGLDRRPARALPNAFLTRHTADAPLGYPALHHLTSPMRKAAAAAGDGGYVNLWAGTGHRAVVERAAAEILRSLATEI